MGLAMVLAAAGCGSDEDDPTEPDAAQSIERLEEEIAESLGSDGVESRLVIAVRRVPDTLDPLGDLDPWGARVAEDLVFEGLTRRSSAGAPWAEPALADVCVVRPTAASGGAPRDVWAMVVVGHRPPILVARSTAGKPAR